MKTYMAHAQDVVRKWYVVDAEGMVLGRLASKVASILRGKNKPTFTPNVDTGDFVIIVNTDKVVLTGKKLEKKYYKYHTGHIGGLKEIQYKTLLNEKSDFAEKIFYFPIKPADTMPKNSPNRVHICSAMAPELMRSIWRIIRKSKYQLSLRLMSKNLLLGVRME